jgi:hypothetical protein
MKKLSLFLIFSTIAVHGADQKQGPKNLPTTEVLVGRETTAGFKVEKTIKIPEFKFRYPDGGE